MKPYYKDNLKKEIKGIRKELIKDCLNSTKNRIPGAFNHSVETKHHDKLYSLFIDSCKKHVKNMQVRDTPTKLWTYYTDKDYRGGYVWHNHINTCSLCGVLYLKTVKGCGIELRTENKITYVEPKDYDLLIFPGSLDHRPLMSLTKTRISLQFEIFHKIEA